MGWPKSRPAHGPRAGPVPTGLIPSLIQHCFCGKSYEVNSYHNPQLATFLRQHLRKILTQKVTQKVTQTSKICAAAKTQQNLTKCLICGVFASRISEKNLRKHQKSVFLRLPFVGGYPQHVHVPAPPSPSAIVPDASSLGDGGCPDTDHILCRRRWNSTSRNRFGEDTTTHACGPPRCRRLWPPALAVGSPLRGGRRRRRRRGRTWLERKFKTGTICNLAIGNLRFAWHLRLAFAFCKSKTIKKRSQSCQIQNLPNFPRPKI